jgi:hypothetical protein
MNLSHLVAAYGYWAVFALVTAESLGIPLPSETALILAAAYAGQTHHLSPAGADGISRSERRRGTAGRRPVRRGRRQHRRCNV